VTNIAVRSLAHTNAAVIS